MSMAVPVISSINRYRRILPPRTYSSTKGRQIIHTIFQPALNPCLTRSNLFAPIFCEVKFDMPFPMVVREVITRLFSLMAAEYPAITLGPNPLITPCNTILPMEIKLCCKILGMATTAIFPSSCQENNAILSSVTMPRSLFSTTATANRQLIP